MTRYHINRNGEIKRCNAESNRCQFGDDSLHFTSLSEIKAFIESVKNAGNANLLLGTKTTRSAILPANYQVPTPTPVPTPMTIPVTNAVASRRWETSGFVTVKMSFLCGGCERVNTKNRTHTVIAGNVPYIATICNYCAVRNVFPVPTNGGRGWLVRNTY